MATLGVVAFRNGSPHGKLHVLQESINNLANTKTGKSDKRDICIIRKKPKLSNSPQAISVTSIINEQNILMQTQQSTAQKVKKQQKVKDSITRVHNPPPIAVARRNARERNRVKQVNNGFATLRQHIPNEIAEIYENANNNRAANKKLSKVETLRMAVEYIRSLENILSLDENGDSRDTSNLSLSSFPSPASSESLQNSSSFDQSYFSLQSPMDDEEDSNPPTPLPPVSSHRYSRIPGTNAFQLIPGPATLNYEDEENIHPLTPNSDLISQEDMMIPANMISANLDYVQGLNQEFTVIHPQMLSPNFYSENSLSPNQNVDILDVKYAPQMNTISGHQIIYQPPFIFNPNATVPLMVPSDVDRLGHIAKNPQDQILDDKIVYRSDLKREPDDLDPSAQQDVEVGNMDEVINWWQVDGNQENHS